ncbi:hypothetical protein GKQ38_00815 [Candidatus Nanohaloarchaea archaeon]|nr:hypothetical protein GKQ38_00815 [Candidatus Nanohaloarchaea archaeon]
MGKEGMTEEFHDGNYVQDSLLEKYRDKITEEPGLEKLRRELPTSTFQRIESLIEEHDSLSEVLKSTGLQEISKIELKYLVSLYTGEPAEFVLEANSLQEQYEIILETLHREVGEVEL